MVTFTVFKGSQSGEIVKSETTRGELTGDQVLVKITASGLCGTDEHYRHADMGLGHEGVGLVEAIGPNVKELKVGDRVGWGYQHDCCGRCEYCLSGRETFCVERAMYAFTNLDQGSFGEAAVWREAFLFPIPEGLTDEEAAPLMCGGATVFNALRMYGVRPTDRVGVIGIGGLGHLAIQFARAMGCSVSVFSSSEDKREEALRLGATDFYATKGKSSIDVGDKKINCLIVTTSAQPGKLFGLRKCSSSL
jgi:D-arabinose 1-dehydrogenase-like Zn-dependent alcohol dehydrogenase